MGGGPSSPKAGSGWGNTESGGDLFYLAVADQSPFAADTAGSGGAGAGGKVGLPALDVSLAFPQATPASLFPAAGEIPPLAASALAVSVVLVVFFFSFELEK